MPELSPENNRGSLFWFFKSPSRLFGGLFALFALFGGIFFFLFTGSIREANHRGALQNIINSNKLLNQVVEEHFDGVVSYVESYARRHQFPSIFHQKNWGIFEGHLQEMVGGNRYIDRVFISDATGTTLAVFPEDSQTVGQNFSSRQWYQAVSKKKQTIVSEVYQTVVAPRPLVVAISTPIRDVDGAILGYLTSQTRIQKLAAWVMAHSQTKEGTSYLIDRVGDLVWNLTPGTPFGKNSDKKTLLGLVGKNGVLEGPDPISERPCLIAYSAVPVVGWTVLVSQPTSEAYAQVRSLSHTLLWLAVLVSGGLFTSCFYWLNSIRHYTERQRVVEAELQALAVTLENRVIERTKNLEQSQELLAVKNEELLRSNRDLEDFAYIASHDLKEPLRGIANYSRFLLEDYQDKLDDSGRLKLEALPRLASHLEGLINSLLYYSKVGRADLAIRPTNLALVVAGVLDSLHISLAEKKVQVDCAKNLPTVVCDQARVAEIFRNLITNSMKYNDKPAKKIAIGALLETVPVFFVRDNGIGIRPDHIDLIFKIFKRLHAKDKFGGGTGVGLTVVKKIVERHGGRLWVESTLGVETTFFFTLAPDTIKL